MDTNNLYILLFNATLYIITLVVYQYRKKKWDIGSCILFLYAMVSVVGVHLFFNPLSSFEDVTVIPFLYLYLMLMIGVYPILKINDCGIIKVQDANPWLINVISWGVIGITVIATAPYLLDFQNTVGNLFKGGGEFVQSIYSESQDSIDNQGDGVYNIVGILSSMVVLLNPLLFFYHLSRENQNKVLSYGLAVATILGIIPSIASSARGLLTRILFSLVFLFVFFNHILPTNKKRMVRKVMVVLIIIITIPFLVITVGRFGAKQQGENMVGYYVEWYLGQSFLYFNNYAIDPGGCRYGDRTAPLFKEVLGLETADNYNKRLDKYFDMNLDETLFSTYVGEFTLDYGVYGAVGLFIFFSILFRKHLKIGTVCTFSQLILYYFLFNICVGIFLFPFADIGGNLQIIMFVGLYFLFKKEYKLQE